MFYPIACYAHSTVFTSFSAVAAGWGIYSTRLKVYGLGGF